MKNSKFFKYYMIATQGISSMVVMALLGLLIGYKINKDSVLPGLLAGIGLLIGLAVFVISLLRYQKNEDRIKRIKEGEADEENKS